MTSLLIGLGILHLAISIEDFKECVKDNGKPATYIALSVLLATALVLGYAYTYLLGLFL